MLKPLFTIFIFLLLTANTQAVGPIRPSVENLLPSELTALSSKNLRSDIEKKMASKVIKKNDSDALYLHYFDSKNDVTIGFKQNRFDYIYIEIPKQLLENKPNFYQEVVSLLSSSQKEKIAKENTSETSHEKGRYILMDIPEEKMKLEFYNNEKKDLRSIILYSKK